MYAISGIVRMQTVFIFHCRKVIEIKNAIGVSIIFILFKATTFQLDLIGIPRKNHGNTEHKITLIWFAFANSAIEKDIVYL
jgi:hypothetical protein